MRTPVWLAMHVCPLVAFSAWSPRFDPQSQFASSEFELRTVYDNGGGKVTFDGWLVEGYDRDTKRPVDIVRVYRDFRLEITFRAGERREKHGGVNVLYAGSNEKEILDWLKRFQRWADHNKFPFPALVFLTVINAGGSVILGRYGDMDRATGNLLPLQPSLLETVAFDPSTCLRASYDHLYQSYGFASCPHFDAGGKWKPRNLTN